MSDATADVSALDLTSIDNADVSTLGESAIGHALRRALALAPPGGAPESDSDPIASHDSYV
jgi:hypothetical protein